MMFCMKGMSRGAQMTQDQTTSPLPVAAGGAQRLIAEPEKQA
jgi:hypothetical protein